MTARWLLVRHGETEWSQAGRYAGHSDVTLSDGGRQAARLLGRRLAHEEIDVCYTSDLRRAAETLDLLLAARASGPGLPVHVCPELREMHFGEWEGRTYPEIAEQPGSAAVLAGDDAAPGGESLSQLAVRIQAFLEQLQRTTQKQPNGAALVVSHGGPVRALVCLALGLAVKEHWRFQVDHGSLSEISWSAADGARLVRLNDLCHLSCVEGTGQG